MTNHKATKATLIKIKQAIVDELVKLGWDLSFDDIDYVETVCVAKSKKTGYIEVYIEQHGYTKDAANVILMYGGGGDERGSFDIEMNLETEDSKWTVSGSMSELNSALNSAFSAI